MIMLTYTIGCFSTQLLSLLLRTASATDERLSSDASTTCYAEGPHHSCGTLRLRFKRAYACVSHVCASGHR